MGGRLGEGTHHELRIHGVAGTPPEGMLDDLAPTWPPAGPCGLPDGGAGLTVWRRVRDLVGVRAYSWGSVTSGSARTALYLLLVPHLLVNLAGWAALPTGPAGEAGLGPGQPARGWPVRLVTAGVRLLALALTVILAQWALLIGLDLVAYQWAVGIRGLPALWLAAGVLLAAAAIELALLVTRVRLRPGAPAAATGGGLVDPVGHAWLTHDQSLLWDSPGTIALQRHAHHGVALGSIGLVGVAMVGGWVPMPQPWVALAGGTSGLAVLLGVAVVVQHSLSSGRPGGAGWRVLADAARLAGRVGVLLAAVAAAGVDLAAAAPTPAVTPESVTTLSSADLAGMALAGRPVFLPVVRDVGMALTLGYSGATLLVAASAWSLRRRDVPADRRFGMKAFALPGLALLAGAVGGGMGAAIAAATSRVLGSPEAVVVPGPLPEALAITFAALAVLLGWVVVVGLAAHVGERSGTWRVTLTTAVHRLLRRGSWLAMTLTAMGVLGVALVGVLVRSPDNPLHVLQGADPLPQVIVLVAAGLVASIAGLAVAVVTGRQAVGGVVAVALLAVASLVVLQVPGDALARQLRPAAMAIGLLTPAGFVAGKGVSALRRHSDRRTVAILWDVGTFLPRWFDPLCPPTYGDRVVTDLQDLVAEQLGAPAAGGGDRTLLLAPHSQGTVIAAAAVLGLPPSVDTQRLALLTYGSPLHHLYAEFFPRLFDAEVFDALHARVGGRWRNIARTSDPIGAPVGIAGVDVVLEDDPCGRGHSAYPREQAYADAAAELRRTLGTTVTLPPAQPTSRSDP